MKHQHPPELKACACLQRYLPESINPMCFCVPCRRWYHVDCLDFWDYIDFEEHDRLFLRPETFQRTLRDRDEAYEATPFPPEAYHGIPNGLVQLARSRIFRGDRHGVVGNATYVLKARTLLRNALVEGAGIPGNWLSLLSLGPLTLNEVTIPDSQSRACPVCDHPV